MVNFADARQTKKQYSGSLVGLTQFFISLPFGVALAALHEVRPNQYRGQITALYLFVIDPTLVGNTR